MVLAASKCCGCVDQDAHARSLMFSQRNGRNIAKCFDVESGMTLDSRTTSSVYKLTAHHCYTSTVTFLRRNDTISIYSQYGGREIHPSQAMSFWGIVSVG